MKKLSTATHHRSSRGRNSCAISASLALLAITLLICPGCDDSISQTIRQSAYSVFETGMETFSSEFTTALTSQIQSVGSTDSTDTTDTTGDD